MGQTLRRLSHVPDRHVAPGHRSCWCSSLEYTRFGAQVRAAVDNQRMARGLGINVDALSPSPSRSACGLAGLGGALAIEIVGLDPSFAFTYLVYVLIVVSVGGLGSIGGSFAAASAARHQRHGGQVLLPGARRVPDLSRDGHAADVAAGRPVRKALSDDRDLARCRRAAALSAGADPLAADRDRVLARDAAAVLVFPTYLLLASQIAITALFALSLDLILGYAGIVSLGHAAFFGFGAYTAGLIAKWGWGEPLTGLLIAAVAAGVLGYLTSFIIARFRHLALIMITLGLGLLLAEAANSASWLTGGADGLQGVRMWPLFGVFDFDLYGVTAYAYSLAVLFLSFLVARRLINSPFGLSLRGIRENAVRMPAIGAPSRAHIRKIYTIAAVHGRRRRRGAGADHRDGVARSAELPALGRRAGDPHSRRRRPALWRPRRRDHLHGGARPVLRHQSAVLVFLDRRAADRRGDVPAERHPRRAGAADRRRAAVARREPRRRSPRAASTRASARSWSRTTSRSSCRRARVTR